MFCFWTLLEVECVTLSNYYRLYLVTFCVENNEFDFIPSRMKSINKNRKSEF